MTISKPRRVNRQLPLFADDDKPIKHVAESRWLCGDFFERLLSVLTGATRLRTDSTADICPDLHAGSDLYFETKSVGRTGSAILYDKRLKNDLAFCSHAGGLYRLHYWFFVHNVAVEQYKWRKDLDAALAAGVRYAVTLTVQQLAELLKDDPVRVMNTSYLTRKGERLGYGSNGYGMGWPVRVSRILQQFMHSPRQSNPLLFDGVIVPPFTTHHVTEAHYGMEA